MPRSKKVYHIQHVIESENIDLFSYDEIKQLDDEESTEICKIIFEQLTQKNDQEH